jgi:hypothetical protein
MLVRRDGFRLSLCEGGLFLAAAAWHAIAVRQKQSAPLVEALDTWMREERAKLSRRTCKWLPGQGSPNPAGRPKSSYLVSDIAKQHTPEALATLVEIMQDKAAPVAARVSAPRPPAGASADAKGRE